MGTQHLLGCKFTGQASCISYGYRWDFGCPTHKLRGVVNPPVSFYLARLQEFACTGFTCLLIGDYFDVILSEGYSSNESLFVSLTYTHTHTHTHTIHCLCDSTCSLRRCDVLLYVAIYMNYYCYGVYVYSFLLLSNGV